VFAIMNQGLYRSNDGGRTWQQASKDRAIEGSWYSAACLWTRIILKLCT